MVNLIKSGAVVAALLFAYWLGLTNGKNSEELKHANLEISALNATIKEFKTKQTSDAIALAQLRIDESSRRSELDRMRQQLSAIDRKAKTDADRQRNRCLRLAIEGKELLEEASRAIRFCEENHK